MRVFAVEDRDLVGDPSRFRGTRIKHTQVYIRSEVDAVLAEKDARITELEEVAKSMIEATIEFGNEVFYLDGTKGEEFDEARKMISGMEEMVESVKRDSEEPPDINPCRCGGTNINTKHYRVSDFVGLKCEACGQLREHASLEEAVAYWNRENPISIRVVQMDDQRIEPKNPRT